MEPERTRLYPFVSDGRPPFLVERTEGAYLVTPDGRRILDAAGGAIVCNVGHGRAEVGEAMARAATEQSYVVPPFATPTRIALVERLRERWLPAELTRVGFASGGSEAMDTALRVVRQHHVSAGRPERTKLIGRDLSYHGTTVGTLSVGGHTKRRAGFEPLLFDAPRVPACYPLRCPSCRDEGVCNLACVEAVEQTLLREGPETVAAVFVEPIGGSTAGALVPPDGYWPRLAEICRRHGVLLVADEVMCGFGRTGKRFAFEHWGPAPDLLVAGKGLAGGYAPICGVFAREEVIAPIAEASDALMFYTFSAQSSSCAAALAVLDILEREDLVARAAEMGEVLRQRLAPLAEHPNVAEVRGRGLLQAVEFVRDPESREPFPVDTHFTTRVCAAALAHGVFLYPGGCEPARDVVVFGPPFTITESEVDQMVGALEKALASALERST